MMIAVVSILFILLLIGTPVAFALAIAGVTGLVTNNGWEMGTMVIPDLVYKYLDSDVMLAVPLYVMMGQILLTGGIGKKLYDFAGAWVRHWPGGLGIATVVSCAIFAAISGASMTTALTIGLIAIPEMVKRGYDKKLVLGLVAAGGSLGILIPPSIPMMLYGFITQESVSKLFIAGIIPGILLAVIFAVYVVIRSWKQREEKASWKERFESTNSCIGGLAIPLLVVGGIYFGWFTPTESAAVGVVLALVICMFGYRSISFKDFGEIFRSTVNTSAMIMMVVVGAGLFGQLLTESQVPQGLAEYLVGQNISPQLFIFLIMILFFILGMFIDIISIVLIVMPIITPILLNMEVDLIWFCILAVVNLELGVITPPVGLNLFAIQGVSKEPMIVVIRGVIPFIVIMIGFLILMALIPELSTWLPSLME